MVADRRRRACATACAPPPRILPEGPAGLLPGLAVGDVRDLPGEVRDDFRAAGLSHLTAVSGSNLVIVAGTVLGLLRLLRADPRVAAVLSAAALLGFVVLARPSPSVLRAAVMGGVVLLALALGRARSAVPALAATVLGLLLVDPALAADPGFGLSVLATAALVLVVPGWVARMRQRGVPPGVAEALAVPAAACLVTAPLIAGLNGGVSLVAVAANLLAAPAVAPATVLGVAAAVLSPVSATAAQGCAWLAGPAVGWLVAVADRAAAVPGGVVPWPDGVTGAGLLAVVVLALVALARSRRVRPLLLAAVVGLLLVLVPTRVLRPGWPPPGWAVVACDVGQGDALVLATGQPGRAVLSTPDRATDRWTPAWTGSGSPHWRSCWSATCTRTTSAASPERCAAGRSARSPSDRSRSRGGRWSGSRGRRPRAARGWCRCSPVPGSCGPPSPWTCSARSTRPSTSTPTTARRSTTARPCSARRPRPAPSC